MNMQTVYIIAFCCLAAALARPGNTKPEDQSQTKWGVRDGVLNVEHHGNLYKNDNHRFDGTASVTKNFVDNKDPLLVGGRVDYKHLPSNSAIGLGAVNAGQFGTKVDLEASRTLFKDRFSQFDAGVSYGQRFGGPFGNSEPVFGGFIRGRF
ncbi:uncharacterized protein [Tenebrio molitor]|uniref:uncharacterized protein n=1 Tax=Tenebrio molitor TaxID=7067 RepID=UPI0036248C2C